MPKIPGVNHLAAIRALEKSGFRMAPGQPYRDDGWLADRNYPSTQSGQRNNDGRNRASDAGLTVEEFRKLL
jgi:hypothetical protein